MNPHQQPGGISFTMHHVMLPVANLDRSIDFYTRLLGMTLAERHASAARQNEVGMVGYAGAAPSPFLELTQSTRPGAPGVEALTNHIGIHVNDLRRLCAMLEAAGVRFMRPIKERGDGKGFTAWVHDPDGHVVELVEMNRA